MVATVHVFFDNQGTDNTPTNETDTDALSPNLRFKTADDATIDAINPIPIPTTGVNNSFWKQIYIEVTTGTFTQIDNVQFYTDTTNFGTGIATFVGDQVAVKNSGSNAGYDVATGVVGTGGDAMETGANKHTDLTSRTDAFSFGTACTKAITISEAGTLINATGESTDYLICQMEVGTTAGPGNLADETWTFQYDEI